MRCLVTGATGYIGGRLVPELLAAGYDVRCMARSPSSLAGRPWSGDVEVARADATDAGAVHRALEGVDVAYYLVHSLASGPTFADRDRVMAETFARAAADAGVGRLVYLGGLTPSAPGGSSRVPAGPAGTGSPGGPAGEAREDLSPHLRSRAEVGEILLASGVPTAVLRAAVILGSGSASFEMLRYLTERLPAMVTPRWVSSRIQPVAIRDVLRYLVGCADLPTHVSRTFDIGGPDVLTYAEMMQGYARAAGLPRRVVLPVPILSPSLSSRWVGLVTPVPNAIARPLVESLRHEVVCSEHDIAAYVPDPPDGLVGFDRAVRLALTRIREADVATRWSSASVPGAPSEPLPTDPDWAGGSLYVDRRRQAVHAPAASLWRVIEGIGGTRGWYSFPLAWRLRGLADRLAGGVGLRRGRRDPDRLLVGESVDFWRVEEMQPGRLLRLRAEMRLPGLAWLELGIEDGEPPVYTQRALFHPRGLLGHVYWWGISPFHGLVFGHMARNIARAAEEASRAHPRR